ncbi:MAG: hypothetical protein NDI75_00060 [Candidatus Didemnitutus sp.]|nr:hypothetical protein [Candidatus Didemnitutus sp.]
MSTPSGDAPPATAARPALIVWWGVWLAMLAGVVVIHVVLLPRRAPAEQPWGLLENIACAQVALSAIIRWLVLPRIKEPRRAFPIFIVGMALAEGAAILGTFLSAHATEFFVLGMAGMMQFVPFFAARLLAPPGTGLMPRG